MQVKPLSDEHVPEFRKVLLWWYSVHARDLPWRRTHDPYKIWVSEVMLQQTRVATIISVYRSFIAAYPSITALAMAGEEEILARWSGLGYYKRARHLHEAARIMLHKYQGKMPRTYRELLKLPGVGEYTAAAVASIAHGEPVAVVDGNVERVITRLLGASIINAQTRKRIDATAQKLVDPKHAGTFNQAMMELGAMLCLPRQPACAECPVREFCRTQGEHKVAPRPRSSRVAIAYQILCRKGKNPPQVLLLRRPADAGQMPGMWELPLATPEMVRHRVAMLQTKHIITHTQYTVSVYDGGVTADEPHAEGREICWANGYAMQDMPLTGVTRKVLMRLHLMPRPLDGQAESLADLESEPVPYGPPDSPFGRRRKVAEPGEESVAEE